MPKRKGYFIAIEGSDFAGKSTQHKFVCDYLQSQGLEVVRTRECGGTPMADEIRAIVIAKRDEPVSCRTEALLFFAAREQHIQQVILPALERGAVVVTDRFVDSTYAYQAAKTGDDASSGYDLVRTLDKIIVGKTLPDLTLMLDLEPTVARTRACSEDKQDRFEVRDISFFEAVREQFWKRMVQDADRYDFIDASQSIEEVQQQILPHLQRVVKQLKGI